MKEYNFKISVSKEIEVGEFLVTRIKKGRENLPRFCQDDLQTVFKGETCKADLLFGWGIAREISDRHGTCLIIFNPEEQVAFPDNCNDGT